MNAFEQIRTSVSRLVDQFNQSRSDGVITLSEIWQMTGRAVSEIVQITNSLKVSGPEKKEAALEAFEQFVDNVIVPLDLPYVPNLIVEPIVDKALKSMLMAAANGLIDAAVSLFNQVGWPNRPLTDHFADS